MIKPIVLSLYVRAPDYQRNKAMDTTPPDIRKKKKITERNSESGDLECNWYLG